MACVTHTYLPVLHDPVSLSLSLSLSVCVCVWMACVTHTYLLVLHDLEDFGKLFLVQSHIVPERLHIYYNLNNK